MSDTSECCHPGKLHLAPGWDLENGTGLFVIDRHLVETWQATPALIATIAKWDTVSSFLNCPRHCHALVTPSPCQGGQAANWSPTRYSNEQQMSRQEKNCFLYESMWFHNFLCSAIEMSYEIHNVYFFSMWHIIFYFSCSARVSIPQMLDNRRMAGCGSSDEDPYRFKVESWSRWWNELWCNDEDALSFKFCSENSNSGHTGGCCFFYCFDG